MENTPEQFKQLANSSEIYDMVEELGKQFSLHIDQIGALDAEIRNVLLGSTQPSEFTKNISESMEIDMTLARKITEVVNSDILQKIRAGIQKQPSLADEPVRNTQSVASLEQVGGFSMEPTGMADVENTAADVTHADKTDILAGIENPPQSQKTVVPKAGMDGEDAHTEPLIDHLISSPTAVPQQTVTKKINLMEKEGDVPPNLPGAVPETTQNAEKTRPSGPDQYREPIN